MKVSSAAMTNDRVLEDAVAAIGEIALSGVPPNTGYIFDASQVRAVLLDYALALSKKVQKITDESFGSECSRRSYGCCGGCGKHVELRDEIQAILKG